MMRSLIPTISSDRSHWVCLSNLRYGPGKVNIFMITYTLAGLKKQVEWMLYTSGKNMILDWPDVQDQKGNVDCGLFLIAVADALCPDSDPCTYIRDQHAMQYHLGQCFKSGKMMPFPTSDQPQQPATPKIQCSVTSTNPPRDAGQWWSAPDVQCL